MEDLAQNFYNRVLLRACADIIFVLDKDMRIVLASDTLAHLLGAPDIGAILHLDMARVFSARMPNELIEEMIGWFNTVSDTALPINITRTVFLLGGSEMTFDFTVSPAVGKFGVIEGIVFDMYDITELDAAKRRAEEASHSKSAFLATMSHEIRTPLNAIMGLSEIEMRKDLPTETRDNLEKIYRSGSNLLGIINDILDISKIEAGSMEIVPSDYNTSELVSSAIQLNLVRIGSKNIAFGLEMDHTIPRRLFGDELRVKQILSNLLSNACKYTEEGFVKLSVVWVKEGDHARLGFRVTDSGQGIRVEDMKKLFDDYTQLNARANRNIEGTGLGLAITKRLAELMNGTVTAESEFGKGSVFTVTVLQKIVDEEPVGACAVNDLIELRFDDSCYERGKNLIRSYMPYGSVLVVDDIDINLDVVSGLLMPYGLRVDCVSSGREAIEKITEVGRKDSETPLYDLVLMDHMMPEMDGIETTERIRRDIGTDYARIVPIIALTANAMTGNEEMFLSKGFDGFISKPIDIMRLDLELNKRIRDKHKIKDDS
ncbi:MAG: ATP-binding protein [Synergistaceae bacterium]|nr:ATP-binding protein [Synergistaceae bacterium]